MTAITLTGGDFGSDVQASVTGEEFFLPSRSRPGTSEIVPLAAIAAIEKTADDTVDQMKEVARAGVRGFLKFGPVGVAAGAFALRKVKNVTFTVRLGDGRGFTATTDAITFAALNSARTTGLGMDEDAAANARADQLIAKYLKGKEVPALADTAAAAPETPAPAGLGVAPEIAPALASPDDQPPGQRPVFGRRKAR